MGIVIRSSLRNAISQYTGIALGAVNTMFLFPYLYGAEFMGQVNTLLASASIFASLGHLGLPHALVSFFPRWARHRQAQFFSFSLVLLALSSVLFLLALGIYIALYKDGQYEVAYLAPIALGMLFFELYAALAQNQLRTVLPEFIRHVFRRLIVSIGLLAAYFWALSPKHFLILLGVGYILQALVIFIYTRSSKLNWQWPSRRFPLRSVLRYSLFISLSASAALLVSRLDVLMISAMIGDAEVAYYSVAFFMASLIASPAKAMTSTIRPLLAQAWARNDREYLSNLYRRSATNQLILGWAMFLMIWVNLDWILLLLKPDFREIRWVFFWVGLGQVVNTGAGPNGLILVLSKKYDHNFYAGLLLIGLTFASNILLIPRLGIEGAALATGISMFVFNGLRTYLVHHYFKLWPYQKEFSRTSLYLLALTLICSYSILAKETHWLWFIINLIIASVGILSLVFLTKAGRDIKAILLREKS